MDAVPIQVHRQFVYYLVPLILIASTYNNYIHTRNYFPLAIIFSTIPPYLSSKLCLILGSILFFFSLLSSRIYFAAYGFILSHAYNNRILISERRFILNSIVFKVEVLAFLISQCIVIPYEIQFVMAIMGFFSCILAEPPCCETTDPYPKMKSIILQDTDLNGTNFNNTSTHYRRSDGVILDEPDLLEERLDLETTVTPVSVDVLDHSKLLCDEYRYFLKGTRNRWIPEFGLLYFIFLVSGDSPYIYAFAFMNIFPLKFTVLIIIALVLLGYSWKWLVLFGGFEYGENVTCRLATGYLAYLLINLVMRA